MFQSMCSVFRWKCQMKFTQFIRMATQMLDSGHTNTHTYTQNVVPFDLAVSPSSIVVRVRSIRKIYVCFSGSAKFLMAKWTQHPGYYLRFEQVVQILWDIITMLGFAASILTYTGFTKLVRVPRHKARLIRDTPLNKPVHFLISAQFFRVAYHTADVVASVGIHWTVILKC